MNMYSNINVIDGVDVNALDLGARLALFLANDIAERNGVVIDVELKRREPK